MSKPLVIIPTYNEKENISDIIDAVLAQPGDFHILVVDDNSPDGTAEIVRQKMAATSGRLHLECRPGKQGLGTAYIHGFRWGLEHGYDYLFEMDADFSHNPEDLPRLMKACREEGADVAVGSRYCRGGKVKDWPFSRIMMSYLASLYVRIITWIPVHDTTAGFVCYQAKVLRTINLDHVRFIGYAFQIEMKYAAWRLGFRIQEVPIVFIDRLKGKSKMSMRIFKEAFSGVWYLRFTSIRKKYRNPSV